MQSALLAQGELKMQSRLLKYLRDVVNQPISTQAIQIGLMNAGMKAVVKAVMKKKRPRLTLHHRKERLDFAISHQH